jgi:hypothetical protein
MLPHIPNTQKASPQYAFDDVSVVCFLLKLSHKTHTCLNTFPLMRCTSRFQQYLYSLCSQIWKEERFIMNAQSTYPWALICKPWPGPHSLSFLQKSLVSPVNRKFQTEASCFSLSRTHAACARTHTHTFLFLLPTDISQIFIPQGLYVSANCYQNINQSVNQSVFLLSWHLPRGDKGEKI